MISPGPQENPVTLPITRAQWQSASVPLSEYQDVVDLTDTFQLKIAGSGTVFIDNIYFSRRPDDTSPSPSEPVTPSNPSPTNNTAPTINLLVAQASQSVSRIDTTAGMVTIIAQVQDADNNDTHTLDWTITGVSNHTVNNAQLTFSPDSIDASQVTVTATATDSGSPALNTSVTLTLDIFTPATTPTTPTQNNTQSGGSGGTNSFWLLMGMFIISVWRKKKT